jgi:hypothetical protein
MATMAIGKKGDNTLVPWSRNKNHQSVEAFQGVLEKTVQKQTISKTEAWEHGKGKHKPPLVMVMETHGNG